MWKRDLSRFFLQLPLDPMDYNKVGCVWRGKLLFFTSYVWGCRHAGLNGQRVSSAVSCIHKSLGLDSWCRHKETGCDSDCGHHSLLDDSLGSTFNSVNYPMTLQELSLNIADLVCLMILWGHYCLC